jgi:hypothetical protein
MLEVMSVVLGRSGVVVGERLTKGREGVVREEVG